MLKIETDYNADGAECLFYILENGTSTMCEYCNLREHVDCPYNDIQKAKKRISEFVAVCRSTKEGHE